MDSTNSNIDLPLLIASYSHTSSKKQRRTQHEEFKNEEALFTESKKEVYICTHKCQTHLINVNSYAKAKFTKNFIGGLKKINKASRDEHSVKSKKAKRKFIKSFGTHFMRRAKMGATYRTCWQHGAQPAIFASRGSR